MFLRLLATTAIITASTSAYAATIDLTDGVFSVTGAPGGTGLGPTAFTETAAGVTFTFQNPSSRGTNQFSIGANGLNFGGGGVSAFSFEFTVDTAIELTGYFGFDQAGLIAANATLSEDGTVLDNGFAFNSDGSSAADAIRRGFGGQSFNLSPTATYSVLVNNDSVTTSSFLTGIEFNVPNQPAPVPLPAGLPLMLAGLGAFAWMRRRQSS